MIRQVWIVGTIISLMIAIALAMAVWDIGFWPTDAEIYYMPAAAKLPSLHYLSEINHSFDADHIKWLHGKEFHVLAISWMQQLMHDTQSLRPLMLLGVICVFVSSILIFLISRIIWSQAVASVLWFLFTFSLWPYLYVLFAKHQTQGLCFFLASMWLMLRAPSTVLAILWYGFAGASMAVSLFSSTVSMVYLPFALMAFYWAQVRGKKIDWLRIMGLGAAFGGGLLALIAYANYPDIVGNIKNFFEYVQISKQANHFYYNQRVLVQWLPFADLSHVRGGLPWVIRYLLLVVPALVVLALISVVFLLKKSLAQGNNERLKSIGLVLLCVSPALIIEIKQIAQYGANYFPMMTGLLILVGAAAHRLMGESQWLNFIARYRQQMKNVVAVLAVAYISYNGYVFASDIYPARMSTAWIASTIEKRGIHEIATYQQHPLRPNVLDYLRPDLFHRLIKTPLDTVLQADHGYLLVPPVSTDGVYCATNCDYTDYDADLILNQIVRLGRLNDYAIASFKTVDSSLIWSQEEEIMAYRSLMLGQFKGGDKSKAWILDIDKVRRNLQALLPQLDEVTMMEGKVRNIGTINQTLMFKKYEGILALPMRLKSITARLYKVGDPQDELVAYVFKVDEDQPHWVPYNANFKSRPLKSTEISADSQGGEVQFNFDKPLDMQQGAYSIVIYRTGSPDDHNFYRIYAEQVSLISD